jgi:hypothetical protein
MCSGLDLFHELEDLERRHEIVSNDDEEFSVASFGVSINSLEELLMKIGEKNILLYFYFCFERIIVFLS